MNARDADLTSNGSLVAVGQFDKSIYPPQPLNSIDTLKSTGFNSTYIYKQNTIGDPVWVKGITGSFTVIPSQILQDPIDGFFINRPHSLLIAGFFIDTADFDPDTSTFTLVSQSQGRFDIFFQKLDTSGNFIWAKSFGGNGSAGNPVITTDASGNIFMAGNYSDTLDADPSSGLAQLISKGGSDFFLLQLDSSGNFQWAISVGGPAQNDGASDIKIRDNSIYLSGTFQDSVDFDPSSATNLLTTQNSAINMFVMKFSPPTIGLNESRSTKTALKIYPNPSDNYVNIDNSKAEWNKLFILDLQGRLIMTNENLNSGIVDLNISNLPNGTYLMRMEGDKISAVDKFIIER